jgi:hypothetical protein
MRIASDHNASIIDQQVVTAGERSGGRFEVRRPVRPLVAVKSRSIELAD